MEETVCCDDKFGRGKHGGFGPSDSMFNWFNFLFVFVIWLLFNTLNLFPFNRLNIFSRFILEHNTQKNGKYDMIKPAMNWMVTEKLIDFVMIY